MKMIDQIIRKEMLPIAEQNGYYLDPKRIPSGWWGFQKRQSETAIVLYCVQAAESIRLVFQDTVYKAFDT